MLLSLAVNIPAGETTSRPRIKGDRTRRLERSPESQVVAGQARVAISAVQGGEAGAGVERRRPVEDIPDSELELRARQQRQGMRGETMAGVHIVVRLAGHPARPLVLEYRGA